MAMLELRGKTFECVVLSFTFALGQLYLMQSFLSLT